MSVSLCSQTRLLFYDIDFEGFSFICHRATTLNRPRVKMQKVTCPCGHLWSLCKHVEGERGNITDRHLVKKGFFSLLKQALFKLSTENNITMFNQVKDSVSRLHMYLILMGNYTVLSLIYWRTFNCKHMHFQFVY